MSIFESDDPTAGVQQRSRRAGWLMLSLTAVIIVGISFFPAPYVIDNPGPTYDTLGSVEVGDTTLDLISISGGEVFDTTGEIRLTTVTRSGNPESLPGWLDVLAGWIDPTRTVIPVDVAYPPGVSVEQNREAAQIDMENSQQEAIAAALSYAGVPFTSTLVVSQALEGGPSEGVLLQDDLILQAMGTPVHTVTELRDLIAVSGVNVPLDLLIERAGREARLVHHFGKHDGIERAFLGRFEHHRAARDSRCADLERDLIHRPVPRRDQRTDADRLIDDPVVRSMIPERAFEIETACCVDEVLDMPGSGARLLCACHIYGRTHLNADGLCHLFGPRIIYLEQFFHEVDPL